mmetsp:Transcript_14422/g.29682  ORF Transcript_14422/g.29682 Transcript_14422/m.29682 type:complete len:203 (-) Transcript_14422:843-1451(-)
MTVGGPLHPSPPIGSKEGTAGKSDSAAQVLSDAGLWCFFPFPKMRLRYDNFPVEVPKEGAMPFPTLAGPPKTVYSLWLLSSLSSGASHEAVLGSQVFMEQYQESGRSSGDMRGGSRRHFSHLSHWTHSCRSASFLSLSLPPFEDLSLSLSESRSLLERSLSDSLCLFRLRELPFGFVKDAESLNPSDMSSDDLTLLPVPKGF